MKIATSAGVALALSFLFYDQRDLAEGVVGQREEVFVASGGRQAQDPFGGGGERTEKGFLQYGGAGIGGGRLI